MWMSEPIWTMLPVLLGVGGSGGSGVGGCAGSSDAAAGAGIAAAG